MKKRISSSNIAKSTLYIVENTRSKSQNFLEFKQKRRKDFFSFDVPLQFPKKWMMGVTSLEMSNTVYIITPASYNFEILPKDQQFKELGIDTQIVLKVEYLYNTINLQDGEEYTKFPKKFIVDSYSEKMKHTGKNSDQPMKVLEAFN